MVQRLIFIVSVALTLIVAISQDVLAQQSDDQRNLPEDRKALVNLVPSARDFVKINQQHKVLMAVIDTGVDYNHLQLLQNIHFQLDASGKPVGLGWDFTGEDAWPAPLVANSLDLNPKVSAEDIAVEKLMSQTIADLLKASPQLKAMFDPRRNLLQEASGLFHGTHVAGLMTYDEPQLGLLVYRALPANITFSAKGEPMADSITPIVKSLQKAIADGARVINMSVGMILTKDLHAEAPQAYQLQLQQIQAVKKLAQENPQVAIVAATGNEGAWLDERARLGMPCGVEASNILCVGATDNKGDIASFSNIVLPDYPFVLASGENILSSFPTEFCNMPAFYATGFVNMDLLSKPAMKQSFFAGITKICTEGKSMLETSGTSMATPIVARLVGKVLLANPNLTGAQAIQKVLDSGENLQVGRMTIRKLRAEKPSWYLDKAQNPRFFGKKPANDFEFFAK